MQYMLQGRNGAAGPSREVRESFRELVDLRRRIHRYPEPGFREENRIPYASKVPGMMHACGHDGHVAMALVAAKLLRKRRASLRGNVKFMFQPAEEGPGGARPMIEAGVLE